MNNTKISIDDKRQIFSIFSQSESSNESIELSSGDEEGLLSIQLQKLDHYERVRGQNVVFIDSLVCAS